MIKNYLRVAMRNLFRDKTLSLVNVSSLAIGVASCILVFLFVQSELSYDTFNRKADRIYRVASSLKTSSGLLKSASTSAAVATALRNEYPGLKVERILLTDQPLLVSAGEKKFYEPNIIYAEDGLLQVFSYPLVEGNAATALQSPNEVLLTKSTAEKYFGNEDALGKTVMLENHQLLKITGILKDVPDNSTIQFDFVVSYLSLPLSQRTDLEDWGYTTALYTFITVSNENLVRTIEDNFSALIKKYAGDRRAERTQLFLQPLTNIHLHSNLDNELSQPGSISYVYAFSIVGFLVLLIACINFINISTARSARRSKEVGIRKVLGANRWRLVTQFLGEAFLYTVISVGVALAVVELFLPSFNLLVGKNLTLNPFQNPELILCLVCIIASVGFVTGGYPALFISSFEPGRILRGNFKLTSSTFSLRAILVSVQFAVSILLISGTITVVKQMSHMSKLDLGFERKNIIVVPLEEDELAEKRAVFENSVERLQGVVGATGMSSSLNSTYDGYTYHLEGTPESQTYHLPTIFAGYNTLSTLQLKMKEGRWFSESFPSDSAAAYVINEAALSRFGWKDGVGKRLTGAGIEDGTVIGVVSNFNYSSLHDNIKPLVIRYSKEGIHYVLIKIRSGEEVSAISSIRNAWDTVYPDHPFRYSFLDDELSRMYGSDEKLQEGITSFSIVAIIITCIGLLGLISYVLEQRRKEIAVRKILGAKQSQIISLLSRDFVLLVLGALCVASPISYMVMTSWLENFAYRTSVGIVPFVFAALSAFILTFATIGFQAIKAARTNPVESLRYE